MGDVITKILMSKKNNREVGDDDRGKVRVMQHEKDLTVRCLLDLRVEGAMSQGTQATSRSWERQGNSFPSRASRKNKALPTPWF